MVTSQSFLLHNLDSMATIVYLTNNFCLFVLDQLGNLFLNHAQVWPLSKFTNS